MEYHEIICTTYLLRDIYHDEANEKIGNHINSSMLLNNELADIHKKRGYKYYVYDSLYPREEDKVYKKGRIYVFKIRSIDEGLLLKIENVIARNTSDYLKIISTEFKTYKQFFIDELYTVTPAVLTINNRFWIKGDSIKLLEKRINDNLIKKYQDYYGENIEIGESLIQGIELKNYKPISIKYKNIKLIGNKMSILVKEDELSQKLAFMALGTGILEKNSSNGMGFCIAR